MPQTPALRWFLCVRAARPARADPDPDPDPAARLAEVKAPHSLPAPLPLSLADPADPASDARTGSESREHLP